MKVAVIGGAGRMGRWFVRHFINQGEEVVVSDIRRSEAESVAKSTGAKVAENNLGAVEKADLVVVSTPIEATPSLLEEISAGLRSSVMVMEISSLKSKVVPVLERIAERGVKTVSVHPLFGPGVQRLAGERVALIPVSDPGSELRSARRLFPEAEIVVVDVEEHDRAMALTLSLPHFLNIAFASVVGEEDLNVLKKLGGTTFALQLVLAEAVMTEDPDLYASIQMGNLYTVECLDRFADKAGMLKEHVARKDVRVFLQFYADVRSSISKDRDFAVAYERMYRALNAL
ncbi:MAG: prephenate dehydrogenase/arogenate dehydrogenase family protein [Nitrososphaeria archaeon]